MPDQQELADLQNIINAIILAQSKGVFKLEQSAVLASNVANVTKFISKHRSGA